MHIMTKPRRCRSFVASVLLCLTLRFAISEGFFCRGSIHVSPSKSQEALYLAPQQLGSFEVLDAEEKKNTRRVVLEDLVSSLNSSRRVDFHEAWDWQNHLMQEHVDRLGRNFPDETPFLSEEMARDLELGGQQHGKDTLARGGVDTIFMLEHEAIYTLGTGSDEKFLLGTNADVPVVRMDRGGEVTYHGPGQLVIYPVLDLRHYRQDIHWYMRALEESILRALKACGVDAERQEDTTGIWINNQKVAAIGVKCRKWITMHGLAVNVERSSLDNFDGIVPCGLEGRKVGCLNQFINEDRDPLTVEEFAGYMKVALEEVFQMELLQRRRTSLPKIESK